MMKVCLVKMSSMGDVLHTLPALTDAKRAIPDLQIDWVIEQGFSEIPCWHSAVNSVIPLALRQWRKKVFSSETRQAWNAYKQLLQTQQYDAVIDAQGLFKSAYFATRLAKGKKYGYDFQSAREGISALFYDQRLSIDYQQHAVERIRKLFASSLGYALPPYKGDYGIAEFFQKRTACRDKLRMPTMLAIHSTTRADKHWNEEYWTTLFSQLPQYEIHLPWGNEKERARAERIATRVSNAKVLPKLTLTALAEHLSMVDIVVSVDTGLSHLAAALNKPNIVLYGATNPNLIGAYGENQHYLHADSMAKILPQQVLEKLNCLTFTQ